jgi:hypothetical protein
MRPMTKTALLTAALALMATPAMAYGPGDNPGSQYVAGTPGASYTPPTVPPSYDGSNNPGTRQERSQQPLGLADARALGVKECQDFKANFKVTRSAFGRCIAAAAKAIRTGISARAACRSLRLSRIRRDGQARSDFRACIIATRRAVRAAQAQS